MKIIAHTTTNLVTKDPAGCLWLFGLFFLVIAGMFVVGLLGAFTNLHELNELERAAAWFASLSGVAAGIWIIYSNPFIKAEFDKREGSVVINRKGFMKNETEKHPLNDIKDIVLNESKDDDGDLVYTVEIKLISGKSISLTKFWLRNKEDVQKIIDEIKNFLELHLL